MGVSDDQERALRASIAMGRELLRLVEITGNALDEYLTDDEREAVAHVIEHRRAMVERARRFYMGLSEYT